MFWSIRYRNAGVLHLQGVGTARNASQALHFFRLAADSGQFFAQYYLALLHLRRTSGQAAMSEEQQAGVPRSCAAALPWARKVARRVVAHWESHASAESAAKAKALAAAAGGAPAGGDAANAADAAAAAAAAAASGAAAVVGEGAGAGPAGANEDAGEDADGGAASTAPHDLTADPMRPPWGSELAYTLFRRADGFLATASHATFATGAAAAAARRGATAAAAAAALAAPVAGAQGGAGGGRRRPTAAGDGRESYVRAAYRQYEALAAMGVAGAASNAAFLLLQRMHSRARAISRSGGGGSGSGGSGGSATSAIRDDAGLLRLAAGVRRLLHQGVARGEVDALLRLGDCHNPGERGRVVVGGAARVCAPNATVAWAHYAQVVAPDVGGALETEAYYAMGELAGQGRAPSGAAGVGSDAGSATARALALYARCAVEAGRATSRHACNAAAALLRTRGLLARAAAWANAGPVWARCCEQAWRLAQAAGKAAPAGPRERLLSALQDAVQLAQEAVAALEGFFWAIVRRLRPDMG